MSVLAVFTSPEKANKTITIAQVRIYNMFVNIEELAWKKKSQEEAAKEKNSNLYL